MNKFKQKFLLLFTETKFKTKDQKFFAKRLSFLIKSGVPVLESVRFLSTQTKSKRKVEILSYVVASIENGQTLAMSLGKFSNVFGNFAINIIKSGESSGTLMANLDYLAEELKKKEALRKKIMSALLYPFIIIIATLSITILLTIYIFPKILPIFQGLHVKLPLSTRIIIYISNLIRHDGLYILLGLIIIISGFFILIRKTVKGRYAFDNFILHIPIIGKMIKSYNLANITRTLGLLLESGTNLTSAIVITADTTENICYKKTLSEMADGVVTGKNLSLFVSKNPKLFPDITGHMIAIGEKSGNLSNTLMYLSEYYETEFEDLTKNLSSTIEPVLMVIMGLMVGFIAISVITPIYEITSNLKK